MATRHAPTFVDRPKDWVGREPHVVEEYLVEVRFAVHLSQRARDDTGRAHVDHEHVHVVEPHAADVRIEQRVIEWPTDHSPFLTRPRAIAELLVSYI